jgi:hypothetical protein
MNATPLVSFLSGAGAVSLLVALVALVGLALNAHALALFALAVGLLVRLLVVADYASRAADSPTRPAADHETAAATARRVHPLRLAA